MKIEQAQAIKDAIEETYGDECRIDESYSGRGMYGKETAALIVCSSAEHSVVGTAATLGFPHHFRVDNMGRDSIVIY